MKILCKHALGAADYMGHMEVVDLHLSPGPCTAVVVTHDQSSLSCVTATVTGAESLAQLVELSLRAARTAFHGAAGIDPNPVLEAAWRDALTDAWRKVLLDA
jgi:hypothetical protein